MERTVLPGRIDGRLTPPSSKSYAQRALAAALLTGVGTVLRGVGDCSDTRSALACIRTLGAEVQTEGDTYRIAGGLDPQGSVLHVGESGLAARLFTPIAACAGRPIRIEGEGSLLDRPMTMMIEPLRKLGASVHHREGFLPFEVCGPLHGGEIEVDGSVSSQFITGLLLALPTAAADTTLHVHDAVSIPYLDMTIDTASRFGVEIFQKEYREFFIPGGQQYRPVDLTIEGDWSAAAMLLVAGAVAGRVRVENISPLSKQADTAILQALVRAGAFVIDEADAITAEQRPLHGFTFDATQCPDLFPALAALAAAAEGETTLIGTRRLIHKESNRAEAICREYGKLGIEVDCSQENVMRIRGGAIRAARVDSCNDHRMAMSLAVAGLLADAPITISGTKCVAKSYPDFFEELDRLRK